MKIALVLVVGRCGRSRPTSPFLETTDYDDEDDFRRNHPCAVAHHAA
jgi:hypothetical protein